MPLRLNDSTRAARLREYLGEDANELAEELATLRLLLEEALNSNHPQQAQRICESIGRIQAQHTAAQVQNGNLVPKTTIQRIALALVELFGDAIRERMSEGDFYTFCNAVLPQVGPLIDNIIKPTQEPVPQEPLQLTFEEPNDG